jgi:hypothetical protein
LLGGSAFGQLPTGWKAHDLNRPAATVVTPAEQVGQPPSDAIVLFDGTDMSKWRSSGGEDAKWKIVDGAMESVPNSGYVVSRDEFGDCQIHVEFATPKTVKGNGQGRGNSGVFPMGEFEVQVLDSFENSTYVDGSAGSIYGQYPPLVNASRKPGEWQSYDIIFRRPRFDKDGKLTHAARMTVLHNGVLIQDSVEAYGPTSWIRYREYDVVKGKTTGPLSLQDHGNPVRYRNIWVRPLAESSPKPAQAYDPVTVSIDDEAAKKLVGKYGPNQVKQENGKLFFYFMGNTPLEMIPHSNTEFGFVETAGVVTFEVDDNGNGKAIEVKLDAAGTRAHKRVE